MKILNTEITIVAAGADVSARRRLLRYTVTTGGDEARIRRSFGLALRKARARNARGIVFFLRRVKGNALPPKAIAKIAAQEVLRTLRDCKNSFTEIMFCVSGRSEQRIFSKHVLGYLDYIVNRLKSPFVTVDAIIEYQGGIVLIKRSNPPYGWALPGGFVDYGESLEAAVRREAKEETSLTLRRLRQFHTYSDPARDPRFHTVGTVFLAQGKGDLKAGDDAAGAKIVKPEAIKALDCAFDHKKILLDYAEIIF